MGRCTERVRALTLAHAIATSGTDPAQVRRLLTIVRHGLTDR